LTEETRYFTVVEVTVNGLSAELLDTSISGSTVGNKSHVGTTTKQSVDWAIDVVQRKSDGSETVLDSKIALVTHLSTDGASVTKTNTWVCPQTDFDYTDSVVVKLYIRRPSATGSWVLMGTWTTEQLTADSLDSATWTVTYYLFRWVDIEAGNRYRYEFHYDGVEDSNIAGFTWTPGPPPVGKRVIGDGLTCVVA